MTLDEFLTMRMEEDQPPWLWRIQDLHRDAGEGVNYNYRPTDYYEHACSTCGSSDEYAVEWPCLTLRFLAMPYADHPDYLEEWRP